LLTQDQNIQLCKPLIEGKNAATPAAQYRSWVVPDEQ
jgi:hypothetical protein